jgi:hypothetical protein
MSYCIHKATEMSPTISVPYSSLLHGAFRFTAKDNRHVWYTIVVWSVSMLIICAQSNLQ